FVPYEAPPEIASKLAELESELDSEQMRTQMVVALDPMSRVSEGDTATLWLDPSRIHLFDPKSGDNLTRVEIEAKHRLDSSSATG
ncbi:MAG TPA: ABC transporter, partial [Aldersonia sp.]